MVPLLTSCVAPSCLCPSLGLSLLPLQPLIRGCKYSFFTSFILYYSLAPGQVTSRAEPCHLSPEHSVPSTQPRSGIETISHQMNEGMDGFTSFPLGRVWVEAGALAPHLPSTRACRPASRGWTLACLPVSLCPCFLFFALQTMALFLLFFMENENTSVANKRLTVALQVPY